MKRLKITTYKSYAYMFRADNQANLPCISMDSSESQVKLFWAGRYISRDTFEKVNFYTPELTSNPKYYMVLFVPHLSFFLLWFR